MIQAAAIFIPALLVSVYCYRRITRQEQTGFKAPPETGPLHPVVDPELCGGCGTCVEACPEGKVLGLVQGKAALVRPTNCRGHGECVQACPLDAIRPSSEV